MKKGFQICIPVLLALLIFGGCSNEITGILGGKEKIVEQTKVSVQSMQGGGSTTAESPEGETSTKAAAPGEATTVAAQTDKNGETIPTTRPSGKPDNSVETVPYSVHTGTASSTKPHTTKPSGETTTASVGNGQTTAPTKPGETTAPPVANGESVAARITYLNEVTDKSVAKLTDAELSALGVSEKKKQEIRENPSAYALYTIQFEFTNHEEVPVTIYRVAVSDNGKGEIYLAGKASATLSISPEKKMSERFLVLASSRDADGFVLKKIGDLTMRVQYAATLSDDTATPSYVYAKVSK